MIGTNDTMIDTNDTITSINDMPTVTKGNSVHTSFSTTKSGFSLQLKKLISSVVSIKYSNSDRTVICLVCNVSFFTKNLKVCLCVIC
jgi:hypothetical protein